MSMSDPLADMLTRIRNAGMARFETVDIPMSKLKLGVTRILAEEGYIRSFKIIKDNRQGMLRLQLKTGEGGRPSISGLRRVSTPGRRIYVKSDEIPRVMSGLGVAIVSTSKGVLVDRAARTLGVGGELLCEVW